MSKQLFKSSFIIACMTLISRLFGFLRDMITGHIFGAGAEFDAFSVAFRIPNLFRRLFAEGSFSQAFVPVLADYQKNKSQAETQQFINAVAGSLSATLLISTAIGIAISPWLVHVFAVGFGAHDQRTALATLMLRITFPYLFFISLTAFAGAILNTYSRFWVAAFTPVFLNITMIAAAIWLAPHLHIPIIGLAWGVFAAGIIQFLFQIPFLKRAGLLPSPKIAFKDPGVKRILKLMVPAIFGVSVGQINLMVDSMFASLLAVGSVSWLYFSDRLMEFPLGIFGVAISTVILPHLSRHHSGDNQKAFSQTLDWAIRAIATIGLPASLFLILLAKPILATLFQHGKFDAHSVIMASQSLMAFAAGIVPFMCVKIFASGFYAKQKMRTPVNIGIIAMISNIILNALLITHLKHAGIALATTLSAILNAGLLLYFLCQQKWYRIHSELIPFLIRVFIANTVFAILLFYFSGPSLNWLNANSIWKIQHLLELSIFSLSFYPFSLFLFGIRPKHFRAS